MLWSCRLTMRADACSTPKRSTVNPESSAVARKSKSKSHLCLVGFHLDALLLLLTGAELLYRRHVVSRTVFEAAPYMEYDDQLGWLPRPGKYQSTTITPDRFRRTVPDNSSPAVPTVLACGDSFTYGCGVGEGESWPDYLAAATGWRVVNAGVSGYGLDQIVLRMEKIIPKTRPDIVILSVIYDDILRCELSKRKRHKPYFAFTDGVPTLYNRPVPSPVAAPQSGAWWENSLIARDLLRLLGLADRTGPDMVREHQDGSRIARYLFSRARELVREYGAELYLVIQPTRTFTEEAGIRRGKELEIMVRALDIPVLNLFENLDRDYFGNDTGRKSLFADHRTPEGNRWVAEKIKAFLGEG